MLKVEFGYLLAINHSTGTVELQPNIPIGSVVALSEREDTLFEESEIDLQVSQLESAYAGSIYATYSESDERKKLTSMLQIPQCNLIEEQAQKLIDRAVEFHAAFALDDGERGEAKGVNM